MHMDRQIELIVYCAQSLQWGIGDTVWSMRCECRCNELAIAQVVVHREAFVQILIRRLCPDRGKIEHNETNDSAHACIYAYARRVVGEKVHIIETSGTASQHLGNRKTCAISHELIANPFRFSRPDIVVEPVHQRQIVGEPAKKAHRGVGMRIHQSWNERMVWQLYGFCRSILLISLTSREDLDEHIVPDRQGMII